MMIQTRIFELRQGKYRNLVELAKVMGISVSQLYQVRKGYRTINHRFIVGAAKAFPKSSLSELFYFSRNGDS